MAMTLKTALQYSVRHHLSAEEVNDMVTIAWRFAFGVMQPWAGSDNVDLTCDCTSADLLMADCPWHGREACRMAKIN